MATIIKTEYGNEAGNGKFKVGITLQYTQTDPTRGYYMQAVPFAYSLKTSEYTSYMKCSWTSKTYAMGTAGKKYGETVIDIGWFGYGQKATYSAYCYYNPSSGGTYRSDLTAEYIIPTPTYTVNYDANGGFNAPSSQLKTYGENLVLTSSVPSKTGYEFVGWNTKADGSGTTYESGDTYTANSKITLYAVWKLASNCYIKVNGMYKPGMLYAKNGSAYKVPSVRVKSNGQYKTTP